MNFCEDCGLWISETSETKAEKYCSKCLLIRKNQRKVKIHLIFSALTCGLIKKPTQSSPKP